MDAQLTYMSQDVVDTFVAIIVAATAICTIAISSMMLDSWWKKRKNGNG